MGERRASLASVRRPRLRGQRAQQGPGARRAGPSPGSPGRCGGAGAAWAAHVRLLAERSTSAATAPGVALQAGGPNEGVRGISAQTLPTRDGAGGCLGGPCTRRQGLLCPGVTGAPGWGFKAWRTRVQQLALLSTPHRTSAPAHAGGAWEHWMELPWLSEQCPRSQCPSQADRAQWAHQQAPRGGTQTPEPGRRPAE